MNIENKYFANSTGRTPSFVPAFAAEKPTEVAAEAASRLRRLNLSHFSILCTEVDKKGGQVH